MLRLVYVFAILSALGFGGGNALVGAGAGGVYLGFG